MEPAHWPLVGREAECAAIAAALEEEPPRSIVVAGAAGVGRTRLAREALTLAEQRGRSTRWVAATEATALVPLGAVAHLFPTVDAAADSLALLQRATRAIAGDGSGPAPVLGIDDVHLLDPLSVTLLHVLARQGVTVVLTVVPGQAVRDPTAPLWKDDLATRIELQPLGRAHTDVLLGRVLDGDVDTRTAHRLWQLTRGNPLFLREMLDDGLRTGRLRRTEDLWRWDGPMAPSQRLTEIVFAQLGDLGAAEWRALQVLATAEPLSVHRLIELSGADAVASLERRGVLEDDDSGPSGRVRAAHPLYTEAVRLRAPEAALRVIRGQLADLGPVPGSEEELVRRCAALLDSDAAVPGAGLLTEAARRAGRMLDHPLAERLARAGIDAGGGAPAYLALAEAAQWQGEPARTDRLAIEAGTVAGTDLERARLTCARVLALFCGLGRGPEARTALDEASATVHSEEARALLAATEATVAFLSGDPEGAAKRAAEVLSTTTPADGGAVPLAAAAAAAGGAVTGRTGQALATVRAGWSSLESTADGTELAFARIALAQAEVIALHLGGRIRELEQRTAEEHCRNLGVPEWAGDAVTGLHRGWAALASGRARVAVRWLTEALGGFERRDPAGMMPLCCALTAMAKALVGDIDGARVLLAEHGRVHHGAIRVFDPQVRLAEACLAAAEGRSGQAGTLALTAAALAAEQGQSAVEALMLHAAVRFGRAPDVVERLRDLAAWVDSPLVGDLAAHAEAAVRGDSADLDRVSRAFEQRGALLFAAEAAAEAAAGQERQGDLRAAAASTARAVALTRDCGLAATPALDRLSPPTLTAREEEVAVLAARGLTNYAIARRLVLSVRTVEAHLAHVYAKLGIGSRGELSTALEWSVPTRTDGRRNGHAPTLRAERTPGR